MFNIETLNGFVEVLQGHQAMGDGMAKMRFVTPDGGVYTVVHKPDLGNVVAQQTGCPSLVRVDLVEVGCKGKHPDFLRWQDGMTRAPGAGVTDA